MPLTASYSSPQLLSGAVRERVRWLELPARRASVGAARAATQELLCAWGVPEEVREDAVLVLSELATNAVRHTASADFLCCVGLTAESLVHLEVHDHDTAMHNLVPRAPGLDDEGGRGLLLVQYMADRWGVERSAFTGGNAVWARFRG
ncbi:ATP-binding protein [Streptomyces sp. NBC_01476]|uniref:ATP-binding protein n=1 Tax=Streptomyces sp. NBC_01476 TaxID=2903881 RepID=UPI002E3659B2|nr:ATP-binding protein [Streptomyces sp. NBC_01476]